MNVFSGDILKPTSDIIGHDDKPELVREENTSQFNADDSSVDFAIAFADIVKPQIAAKHDSRAANKSVDTGISTEHSALVVSDDKLMTPHNFDAQKEGGLQWFFADEKLVAKVVLTNQTTSNMITSSLEVRQEKNKLLALKQNANVPEINTGLIKNAQPALAEITNLKVVQNQINDTSFVDIEGIQEKITPNKISMGAHVTLQPKQQAPIVTSALLPAHNFATPHELQPSPIGVTDLKLQASVHPQPPVQTSVISQTIITQIREPMREHLATSYETLQNRSIDKPQDIIVQLSPAELGRVQIRFSFDAGERLIAQVVSENHETMAVLRQKSGSLLAQLKLSGFENVDLSFDASGQKSFSGQHANTGFFNNQNDQAETKIWQSTKTNHERDVQHASSDDHVYPLHTYMLARSAQIDIIL